MTKFLSNIEQLFLDELFGYKTVKKWKRDGGIISQKGKKSVIPIGVHWLKIRSLEWKKSKKGSDMLHLQIWKPPEHAAISSKDGRREVMRDISFDLINCYHLPSNNYQVPLKDKWYFPVGTCYTRAQLDALLKMRNKPFKALVKHVEQEFNDHYFTKAEIRYVFQEGEEIDEDTIDYLQLYERIER